MSSVLSLTAPNAKFFGKLFQKISISERKEVKGDP
jgi:hypothetical protein